MHRILTVLVALLLTVSGAAAQAPFQVPDTGRIRVVTRALGWTVLRDVAAPHGAAEVGMVLIRAQRPVPPAARPGHLARTLRSLRPFQITGLPAEDHLRLAGLPGDVLQAHAIGQPSGVPVVLRAVCLYAPERSWLLIASAPEADWAALESALAAVLEGFRPG